MNDRKIEIKRNIIEQFLMIVKNFVRHNMKIVIISLISIFVVLGIIISGIVIVKNKEEKETIKMETILETYSNEKDKEKNFQKTVYEINSLVDSSISGYVHNYGYYVIAGLCLSVNKYGEGKDYLLKFVKKSLSSSFAPLALQRAGIAYEKLNDNNKALEVYIRLEKEYKNSIIADEINFDLGRMYQIKGDMFKAREYFNKVIMEFPVSVFALKAKKRIYCLVMTMAGM